MTYEDVLQKVGVYGSYQKRMMFLIFCTTMTCALGTLSMIFTMFVPDHRCKIDGIDGDASNGECSVNFTGVDRTDETSLSPSKCNELQVLSTVDNCTTVVNITSTPCEAGWVFAEKEITTLVTEFGIVCSTIWLKPLAVSMFMIGELVGGSAGGIFSDKFGRRPTLLWSKLLEFCLFFAIGFSPNMTTYIVLMVCAGAAIYSSYTIEFVVGNELMGMEHRNKMCLCVYGGYGFGAAVVPLIGYAFADWRWLQRFTGMVGLLYIPLYWLLPESPYWLLSSGKFKEAAKLLEHIAVVNGKTFQADNVAEIFQQEDETNLVERKKETESQSDNHGLKHLLFNSTVRMRFLVVGVSWIVTNMVYYAMALNITALSGNRFWNAAISGLLEFPGIIAGYLTVEWLGRPISLATLMGFGGICLAIAPLVELASTTCMTVMVIIGKTVVIGAFYINFSVTGEMSPTLQRNIALGSLAAAGKIGSFTAPYLMFLGETTNQYIPLLIMGGIACLSAFMSLLVLPETKNEVLPDSIDDALKLKPKLSCGCYEEAVQRKAPERRLTA